MFSVLGNPIGIHYVGSLSGLKPTHWAEYPWIPMAQSSHFPRANSVT